MTHALGPTKTPTATVLRMPGKFRAGRSKPWPLRSPAYRRRIARQQWSAGTVAAVAMVLTGLSLSHLAHGIELVTRAPAWEAWSMAVGIDLGFIALEIAQLCAATPTVRREIARYTTPAIIGTLVASAVMNGLAFGAQAEGWMVYPAVGLGVAIPALVYALSRVAFGLSVSR
jgi:hypothetical protein